jgi:flagellar basal-body rod modification protein FlgD
MEPVSSNTFVNANFPTQSLDRMPIKTLGQKEFLQLLVVQLSNQDPLEPVKDTEFIAQMAQFTSLEQVKSSQQFNQANAMIGQNVTVRLEDGFGGFTDVTGRVTGLNLEQGTPKVIINDEAYAVDKVVRYGLPNPQDPSGT